MRITQSIMSIYVANLRCKQKSSLVMSRINRKGSSETGFETWGIKKKEKNNNDEDRAKEIEREREGKTTFEGRSWF